MNAPHLNLNLVSAVLVDPDPTSTKIMSRMLEGFGFSNFKMLENGMAALQEIENEPPDIIFCESILPDVALDEFIRNLRQSENKAIRIAPILVFTGYTQRSTVETARDAGANLVLKKPISATALYDRLSWVARGVRAFIESETYIGPDRRFKNAGLPNGVGRRATDLGGDVGAQTESNMSQDEIDSMITPMKIDL